MGIRQHSASTSDIVDDVSPQVRSVVAMGHVETFPLPSRCQKFDPGGHTFRPVVVEDGMDPAGRDGTRARGFWWDRARALRVGRDLKYILYHSDELTFMTINFLSPDMPNIDTCGTDGPWGTWAGGSVGRRETGLGLDRWELGVGSSARSSSARNQIEKLFALPLPLFTLIGLLYSVSGLTRNGLLVRAGPLPCIRPSSQLKSQVRLGTFQFGRWNYRAPVACKGDSGPVIQSQGTPLLTLISSQNRWWVRSLDRGLPKISLADFEVGSRLTIHSPSNTTFPHEHFTW